MQCKTQNFSLKNLTRDEMIHILLMAIVFMKFLCDHMLVRLGKWLRAAGYDTKIILDNRSDNDVLALALKEHRYLLTRDQHFLEMTQAVPFLIYFKGNTLETCIQELNHKMEINWLFEPFSRCLICNTILHQEAPSSALETLPLDILEQGPPYLYCPHCQKIYWNGTHAQRMLSQLHKWNQLH